MSSSSTTAVAIFSRPWAWSFQPNIQTYVHFNLGPARQPLGGSSSCNPGITNVGSLPTFASVLRFALAHQPTVEALNAANYVLPNDIVSITVCTESEQGRYDRRVFWGPHHHGAVFSKDEEDQPSKRAQSATGQGNAAVHVMNEDDEYGGQLLWEEVKYSLGKGQYNMMPLITVHLADEPEPEDENASVSP